MNDKDKPARLAADMLQSIIVRIEKLEEEKKAIAADIRDVKSEAKGQGFDVKTINEIIKLRKMDAAERAEREALLDIYKAALGMLDGTPLGSAALDRLMKKPEPAQKPDAPSSDQSVAPEAPTPQEEPPLPAPTVEPPPYWHDDTADKARERGAEAHRSGKPVIANPYPAGDARRAAFDEGWCREAGSDGMDVPDYLRRTPKKPKASKPPEGDDADVGAGVGA